MIPLDLVLAPIRFVTELDPFRSLILSGVPIALNTFESVTIPGCIQG